MGPDEFSTEGLPVAGRRDCDTERNALGWYNNERQYCARARLASSAVHDGLLWIIGRREHLSAMPDWGGQRYSSARLVTRGRAAWPFDAPQYLLLNVAIGADLGGAVDEGIFPVALVGDQVRVHQAGP